NGVAVNVDVNVTRFSDDQSEVTVAVNPNDPNNVVVAPNDSNPQTGIFGATSSNDSVWVSTNGGKTFAHKIMPLPGDATLRLSHGDPTLAFSRDGSRLVYAHMVDKQDSSPPHDGRGEIHGIA